MGGALRVLAEVTLAMAIRVIDVTGKAGWRLGQRGTVQRARARLFDGNKSVFLALW